jgi:hypothetical protein
MDKDRIWPGDDRCDPLDLLRRARAAVMRHKGIAGRANRTDDFVRERFLVHLEANGDSRHGQEIC